MEKIVVYNAREIDERKYLDKISAELGVELIICHEDPTMKTVHLAAGCKCIDIITTKMDAELIQAFYDQGVRYITTRSIGYDHIDLKKCAELGVSVGHATYGPHCVAEYAVMLMLMSIRKMKFIMQRADLQDFSLPGNIGRELKNFTVGVLGTGKIGKTVIEILNGFGCKILAYDLYKNPEVEKYAKYAELDEIFAQCDLLTLHMPLFDSNFHIIDAAAIAKMKQDVVIVNTGRGGLIDSEALIAGLESGKIGAAGLDVVEHEFGLYYNDLKGQPLDNRQLAILKSFPNVVVTPHMAFYTEETVASMAINTITSCVLYMEGKENPWQVL